MKGGQWPSEVDILTEAPLGRHPVGGEVGEGEGQEGIVSSALLLEDGGGGQAVLPQWRLGTLIMEPTAGLMLDDTVCQRGTTGAVAEAVGDVLIVVIDFVLIVVVVVLVVVPVVAVVAVVAVGVEDGLVFSEEWHWSGRRGRTLALWAGVTVQQGEVFPGELFTQAP